MQEKEMLVKDINKYYGKLWLNGKNLSETFDADIRQICDKYAETKEIGMLNYRYPVLKKVEVIPNASSVYTHVDIPKDWLAINLHLSGDCFWDHHLPIDLPNYSGSINRYLIYFFVENLDDMESIKENIMKVARGLSYISKEMTTVKNRMEIISKEWYEEKRIFDQKVKQIQNFFFENIPFVSNC